VDGRVPINGTIPAGCLHRSGNGKYNTNTYANSNIDAHTYSKGVSDAEGSAYPRGLRP